MVFVAKNNDNVTGRLQSPTIENIIAARVLKYNRFVNITYQSTPYIILQGYKKVILVKIFIIFYICEGKYKLGTNIFMQNKKKAGGVKVMPDTKKVRELMLPISEYPVVYEDDTLKDAIKKMKSILAEGKEHRSMMVFSRTKKVCNEEQLVAILTVRDILNTIKRNRMLYDNTELFTLSWAFFYHKTPLEQYTVTKVGQSARPLVKAFLQGDDDVTRAIELMMTQNVNIIPVFEDKKAIGIIRALDILDYIGEML